MMSAVLAQAPLRFPTHTIEASATVPDLASDIVPPLAYGSMEVTVSDPAVAQRMARPRAIADPKLVPGRPHRCRRSRLLAAVRQR
jgi:hypothetical protein